jgi:tRNA (cytidine/uridine-2'-O-)-methyltransferase
MNTNSVTFFVENPIDKIAENVAIILAVWEITNPGNVGNIIRTAHNLGAEKVLFVNDKPTFNYLKIKKTAGFSYEQMKWKFISQSDFYALLEEEYKLVVLETCNGAENIYDVALPSKAIILAGNESYGLTDEVIEKADRKVFIPMPGECKSMNVSHALAVAGFEWYRQMA